MSRAEPDEVVDHHRAYEGCGADLAAPERGRGVRVRSADRRAWPPAQLRLRRSPPYGCLACPGRAGLRRWVRAVWRRPAPRVRMAWARARRDPARMRSFLARVMPV